MSRKSTSPVRKPHAANRRERLDLRLDADTRRLIERAARLEGRTVTEYCVSALAEIARRVVERHEVLVLSERDRRRFFDVLMTPPPANERLERAFEVARRRVQA